MKRKISSLITAVMIFMVCLFASACGDKYKDLEFKVLYAFSENAEEWIDGSNGISLNYNPKDIADGEGENSSLVFNSNGVAKIYIKIQIENVKSKYVDSITVTSTSVIGLDFSSKRVSSDEVFAIPVTANVNTTLKLYENNSGKKHEVPFVVSRELEGIEADLSVSHAITLNSTLNLASLNNLTYLPENQTNQIGVSYSVHSIGYIYDNTYTLNDRYKSDNVYNYINESSINRGVLEIKNGVFLKKDAYVIKIKATSIFHDGVGNDEISAYFYVYVADESVPSPVVKFKDADEETILNQINIYENGGAYSTSTFFVDTSGLSEEVYYGNGVKTLNGDASFVVSVYVLNSNNQYEKYDFENAKYQEGINGLIIVKNDDGTYSVSMANRNVTENKVKVVYEIQGLEFKNNNIKSEKLITVKKGVLPTCITVNDAIDLNNTSPVQNAVVYGTKNDAYKGLALKLSANPNDNTTRQINLSGKDLIITNKDGKVVSSINSGETIYVKFENNVTTDRTLTISTYTTPTY